MHSVPLLLRHSLRSGVRLAKSNSPRLRPPLTSAPLTKPSQTIPARRFSVCVRCQFRAQLYLKSSREVGDRGKNETSKDGALPTDEDPVERPTTPSSSVANEAKPERRHPELQAALGGGGVAEEHLPSETEGRRSQISKKFTDLMDNLQSNVFTAGQRLNDLTGYSSIEKLKSDIEIQENRVRAARSFVRQAKDAYSDAINQRSASQREVNELLQRKHAWSPADLERFTSLYRSDHANEVAESEAREALSQAEREVEGATTQLNRSILSRYHEEQIWSDKIRRMSTWGTWGLMGVNVLLFLIFQILVEPWRRQRLVKGFEEKVKEAIENEAAATRAIAAVATTVPLSHDGSKTESPAATEDITSQVSPRDAGLVSEEVTSKVGLISDPVTAAPITTVPGGVSAETLLPDRPLAATVLSTEYWRQTVRSLMSDRSIIITQRELTTVAVQSAAAGAAVVGLVIAILRPH